MLKSTTNKKYTPLPIKYNLKKQPNNNKRKEKQKKINKEIQNKNKHEKINSQLHQKQPNKTNNNKQRTKKKNIKWEKIHSFKCIHFVLYSTIINNTL